MKYLNTILCTVLCVIFLSCGSGSVDEGDLQQNPELRQTVLTIVDSIGVEMGDSCYIFGSIEGLGYTQDDNIAVLDRISADIRVFSHDGEYMWRAGGRGGGPGEMHNPLSLFLFPDGRMGALDPWRSGLQIYSRDGEYQGIAMDISNNVHIYPETVNDSSFVSLKTEFIIEDGAAPQIAVFVALFEMSAEPEITYWREEMEADFSTAADLAQKYLLAISIAVDTLNNIVYLTPYSGTDYVIERYSLDGERLTDLELEIETVPLTEEEIHIAEEFVRQRLSNLEGGEPQYNVHVTDPITHRLPVIDLEIDSCGNLWARRGTEDEPYFDIWSAEGELIGNAVMAGAGSESRSWEFELCSNRILVYDTDPDLYQKIYIIDIDDLN